MRCAVNRLRGEPADGAAPPVTDVRREVRRLLRRWFVEVTDGVRKVAPFASLSAAEWAVFLRIAMAWGYGESSPSQTAIASFTGYSVRTVRRLTDALAAAGVVSTETVAGTGVAYGPGVHLEPILREQAWGCDPTIWTRGLWRGFGRSDRPAPIRDRLAQRDGAATQDTHDRRTMPPSSMLGGPHTAQDTRDARDVGSTHASTAAPDIHDHARRDASARSSDDATPSPMSAGSKAAQDADDGHDADASTAAPDIDVRPAPVFGGSHSAQDTDDGHDANAWTATPDIDVRPAAVSAGSRAAQDTRRGSAALQPSVSAGHPRQDGRGPAPLGLTISSNLGRVRVVADESPAPSLRAPVMVTARPSDSLLIKKIKLTSSSQKAEPEPPRTPASAAGGDTLRAIACRALTARYRGGFPDRSPPATFAVTDVDVVVAAMAGLALSEPDLDQLHLDAIAGASSKSKKQPPTVGFIWGNREYFLQNAADGRSARQAAARVAARKPRGPKPPEDPPATCEQLIEIARRGIEACSGRGEDAPRPRSTRFLPVDEPAPAPSPSPPTPEDSRDES